MTSQVVLVPGLWMPAAIMAVIAWRLRRAGFEPHYFAYSGRDSGEANLERLASSVEGRAVHFVGHSLGGVLISDLLCQRTAITCGNVVLLGSPVRWMLGGCDGARRSA